jgi:hypothetical protein
MDLDGYRRSAEAFISELMEEYYRHYAGHKQRYEVEAVYERHPELFAPGMVDSLRGLVSSAPPGSEGGRRLRILLDFAIDGLIGQATKELEGELGRREASLSIELDGESIGFRESAVVQANEADAGRRAVIEEARLELIERELNPLYRELIERQHEFARELGYASYRHMCAECKQMDLDRLAEQTARFARRTATPYPTMIEPELRETLGLGLQELRRSDLPRFFRTPESDRYFPAERLVDSFIASLGALGIDISAQPGVVLDVQSRPGKAPRAFCAPVRTPDEVYLVIAPVGGRDDYSALFHEGGHTEHFANMAPELPFEYRFLGDHALTESFAFLFQYMIEDPVWLSVYLGIEQAEQLAAHARAVRLVYLRRYTAKLAYERELHGPRKAGSSLDAFPARYAELLGGALLIPWPSQTFLSDVDPGFYCACYLRAWALETHLRRFLRERFGERWFQTRDAGEVLRGLWRHGQRLSAEELLGELTGEELDFASLAGEFA